MSDEDKNKLISLAEAAEQYGFSHNYLRRLVNRARLNAQKVGNSWVTTPADVEEFIQSRKKMGTYRSDISI